MFDFNNAVTAQWQVRTQPRTCGAEERSIQTCGRQKCKTCFFGARASVLRSTKMKGHEENSRTTVKPTGPLEGEGAAVEIPATTTH